MPLQDDWIIKEKWYNNRATINVRSSFVTQDELTEKIDALTKKIYDILYNLKKIDISEKDFMELMKE